MTLCPEPSHTNPTIGLVSTFPPTQCGLATFSAPLVAELRRAGTAVEVVRVLDAPESGPAEPGVHTMVNGSHTSLVNALEVLNATDVVIVQHEYGIYGGPDGVEVLHLLDALTVPSIVVLHTVLENPTRRQRHILLALIRTADMAVTMTHAARRRLIESYGVDSARVQTIPHGAMRHDVPATACGTHGSRPLIVTWGLLGPGKGIEWAIDAMPALRDLRPRYLVVGKTHPKVLERDGEAYRSTLQDRALTRGVSDIVEFDNSYIGTSELATLVAHADVVLLPYDSTDQVTSGVLIEAVAAGRPVVSTKFPHATELLGGGAGIVIAPRDPQAIATAVRRVLTDRALADEMARIAMGSAPELFWDAVAARYQDLVGRIHSARMPARA